jgi:hypothetical protein
VKEDTPLPEGTDESSDTPRFWDRYEKFREEHDLSELGIDPEEVFGESRDPSPGRDFEW